MNRPKAKLEELFKEYFEVEGIKFAKLIDTWFLILIITIGVFFTLLIMAVLMTNG